MRFLIRIVSCLFLLTSQNFAVLADTLILRDHVGQLIGSIVHQTSEVVIIDIRTIPFPVRRADIVEIFVTGGQPQLFGNPSGTAAMPNAVGFESGANLSGMTTITPLENTLSTSGIPFSAPNETPVADITLPAETVLPIESQPFTGFPESMLNTIEMPTSQPIVDETPSNQPLLPVVLPTGKAYQVSGAGVRFRQGPSLDYPIVSTLPGRGILLEKEISDGWLHAKTLDGTEGWIHLNFVQPMQNQLQMVTGDNLHVREAAGEIYRSLARLRRGDIVVKLDDTPGWSFILTNDAIAGWSNTEFLQSLDDLSQLTAPMRMVDNNSAGLPVIIERIPESAGQKINFTVRDDNIVSKGKTKICVLRHTPPNTTPQDLNYVSETILQRQKLDSSTAILHAGFPESLAVEFTAMDILTMLGAKTTGGWQYSLSVPSEEQLAYAFIVQEGPNRSTIVFIP